MIRESAAAIAAALEHLDKLYCLSGDLGTGWHLRRSSWSALAAPRSGMDTPRELPTLWYASALLHWRHRTFSLDNDVRDAACCTARACPVTMNDVVMCGAGATYVLGMLGTRVQLNVRGVFVCGLYQIT